MTKVKGDLLEKIQTFIAKTPYEVQEVTKAENQLNQLIETATK
ncbi:hypothetical protein [Bacillus thuringiensis]|nr:hypothetical protein [Bacillus thuringiensis]